ncbi:DNA mismatch repair protein MutS [bacterium]|nr:DNA mismatch repair protein MutS [bacterium]
MQDRQAILQRLDAVDFFVSHPALANNIRSLLKECGDLERVIGRIIVDKAPVSDYVQIKKCTELLPQLVSLLLGYQEHSSVQLFLQYISIFPDLHEYLERSLYDGFEHEYIIKPGFDERIDRARELVEHASQKILQLELQEQQRTGISGLKIRHNSVQGYYIELTKMQAQEVPSDYKRLQTLVGKERFMTDQLAYLQHDIEYAAQSMGRLEKEIFESVKARVRTDMQALRAVVQGVARLDVLINFAHIASQQGYVRPEFHDGWGMQVQDAKHPLLQDQMGSACIGNDVTFHEKQKLLVITGPNMGGKSTYLRQAALLHIMAQAGSFVCAKSAKLPILDKIFTRIGAGDNIAQGKSTFLVEMEETAFICQYATHRSLLILDEIGRGTSTFDGIALAQAVLEFVYNQIGSYCLFATHYQELTELGQEYDGVANYYAASTMQGDQIVFLHKMLPGRAQGSFGIQVAKLAGLPRSVIAQAQKIYTQHARHAGVTQQTLFNAQPATKINENSLTIFVCFMLFLFSFAH